MKPQTTPAHTPAAKPMSKQAAQLFRPEQTFHFPEGVLGFEDARQFVFICKPETSPFVFMRALEPTYLGFVCVDPFLICPDYKPRISDTDISFLELTSPAEVLLLSIVNPAPDARQTTANLQGPLAINLRNGKGKQILCNQQNYPVRNAIWEALERLDCNNLQTVSVGEPNRSAA